LAPSFDRGPRAEERGALAVGSIERLNDYLAARLHSPLGFADVRLARQVFPVASGAVALERIA
jgi:hypothetical protein